ncbi:hypothetical protein CTRI78_v003052 [Colletotrichum trifolii]|uniref:Uncharacterized protein n=1 Tax=Colletotrichum trifolii TaxID=5466 RepID=A0A4R8RKB6_COLTR|nr:hypothetical protein CTRI78_v003052 [Colletotrichum trifolii]
MVDNIDSSQVRKQEDQRQHAVVRRPTISNEQRLAQPSSDPSPEGRGSLLPCVL